MLTSLSLLFSDNENNRIVLQMNCRCIEHLNPVFSVSVSLAAKLLVVVSLQCCICASAPCKAHQQPTQPALQSGYTFVSFQGCVFCPLYCWRQACGTVTHHSDTWGHIQYESVRSIQPSNPWVNSSWKDLEVRRCSYMQGSEWQVLTRPDM